MARPRSRSNGPGSIRSCRENIAVSAPNSARRLSRRGAPCGKPDRCSRLEWRGRALDRMAQGAFDRAVKTLQSALQIRPGDLAAEVRLAESLTAVPDWNGAAAL